MKNEELADAAERAARAESIENEQLFSTVDIGDDDKPYLGDPEVLSQLLRSSLAPIMELVGEGADGEKVSQEVTKQGRSLAKIVLGQDEGFTPVAAWNRPGTIDQFIKPRIDSADDDPTDIIASMMFDLAGEMVKISEYASTPDVLDEQWTFQVGATIDQFASLLLGVEPDQDEGTQPDEPADDEPDEPETPATRTMESLLRRWSDYP